MLLGLVGGCLKDILQIPRATGSYPSRAILHDLVTVKLYLILHYNNLGRAELLVSMMLHYNVGWHLRGKPTRSRSKPSTGVANFQVTLSLFNTQTYRYTLSLSEFQGTKSGKSICLKMCFHAVF